MRVALFDIDGTLLSTGGAGFVALRRVYRDLFGVDDAAEGIAFHGRTDPMILQTMAERHLGRRLSPDEMDEVVRGYEREMPAALAASAGFTVLRGARELVAALAADPDVALGLATGNLETTAYAKLRRAGLDGAFAFGGFGSDSADREELTRLAVRRGRERAGAGAPVVVVGDTVHDVRCALAAGASCLAVATGNADEATLAAAGATWVVPDLEDLRVGPLLGVDPRPAGRRPPSR